MMYGQNLFGNMFSMLYFVSIFIPTPFCPSKVKWLNLSSIFFLFVPQQKEMNTRIQEWQCG